MGKKNQRARYLLNVPDLIHHERLQQNGKVVRCHLITEDVSETKRKNKSFPFPEIFSNWGKKFRQIDIIFIAGCTPVKGSRITSGLSLGQFKVLLGTLAQFHAVGIAWSLGTRDDSILDLFPFLHKKAHTDQIEHQQTSLQHLENYERLLYQIQQKKLQ